MTLPWRAHFGEKMMRTYITNGERTIYTSKDDADFLVEALNRSAKVESIEIAPARFYGGTIQDEIARAQIHGPNALTLEALETTLARAEAAERDFIQVHKNCIEARARAEKAEQALSERTEFLTHPDVDPTSRNAVSGSRVVNASGDGAVRSGPQPEGEIAAVESLRQSGDNGLTGRRDAHSFSGDKQETPHPFDFSLDEYIAGLKWSDQATDHEKTLVIGNLRGMFAVIREKHNAFVLAARTLGVGFDQYDNLFKALVRDGIIEFKNNKVRILSVPSARVLTAEQAQELWPQAGTFHCACVFNRAEDFGEATLVTACAYHSKLLRVHDWQPDGGKVTWESHPGGEALHVHTTCLKCGARAWFLEFHWELLTQGCGDAKPSYVNSSSSNGKS